MSRKSWTIKADYLLLYIVNKYNQTIINVIIFLTHNFNSITYEMSAVVMIKTGFWAFACYLHNFSSSSRSPLTSHRLTSAELTNHAKTAIFFVKIQINHRAEVSTRASDEINYFYLITRIPCPHLMFISHISMHIFIIFIANVTNR